MNMWEKISKVQSEADDGWLAYWVGPLRNRMSEAAWPQVASQKCRPISFTHNRQESNTKPIRHVDWSLGEMKWSTQVERNESNYVLIAVRGQIKLAVYKYLSIITLVLTAVIGKHSWLYRSRLGQTSSWAKTALYQLITRAAGAIECEPCTLCVQEVAGSTAGSATATGSHPYLSRSPQIRLGRIARVILRN